MEPLQNAISRRCERQSKLARFNKDDPDPHWLDVLLFHSHPPVQERLAMAEEVLG